MIVRTDRSTLGEVRKKKKLGPKQGNPRRGLTVSDLSALQDTDHEQVSVDVADLCTRGTETYLRIANAPYTLFVKCCLGPALVARTHPYRRKKKHYNRSFR